MKCGRYWLSESAHCAVFQLKILWNLHKWFSTLSQHISANSFRFANIAHNRILEIFSSSGFSSSSFKTYSLKKWQPYLIRCFDDKEMMKQIQLYQSLHPMLTLNWIYLVLTNLKHLTNLTKSNFIYKLTLYDFSDSFYVVSFCSITFISENRATQVFGCICHWRG